MEFLVYGIIGYFVWRLLQIGLHVYNEARHGAEFEQRFREHLEQIIHVIRQEQDGDMYYWYDNDSGDFLAQGRTWEEVVGVLRERFRDHIFVLNSTDMIMGPDFEVVQFDTRLGK